MAVPSELTPSRGLLVGILLVLVGIATVGLALSFGWGWQFECEGSDVSSEPAPASDQARLCNAGGGAAALLFWITPGIALAVAVIVGIRWMRGRVHGAWVAVWAAVMLSMPPMSFVALTWSDDACSPEQAASTTAECRQRGP